VIYASEVLGLPGVIGSCLGTKIKNGVDTGIPSIIFLVEKKQDVKDSEKIPPNVEGIPSDVIESPLEWLAGYQRPVRVGDGIGPVGSGIGGTCGGYYVANGSVYMLTAGHVTPIVKREVAAPGGMMQYFEGVNRYGIGIVEQSILPFDGGTVDAASIKLYGNNDIGLQWTIGIWKSLCEFYGNHILFQPTVKSPIFSSCAGNIERPHMVGNAKLGDPIITRGSRSGIRTGKIFSTDLQVKTKYGQNDVHLYGLHAYLNLGMVGGDSGSLVWINGPGPSGRCVGTVAMGSPSLTVGIPLVRQLSALHPDVETIL